MLAEYQDNYRVGFDRAEPEYAGIKRWLPMLLV
jgi:hypothetical protein